MYTIQDSPKGTFFFSDFLLLKILNKMRGF